MKTNSFLIIFLTAILYLSFSVPSASAGHKQRNHRHRGHWEVRKIRVPSTNKKIRKLSTKHRRQGGHWKVRRVWVPPTPTYKKVRIPGHYTRLGKGVIGHWIRIVDQPGYWTKTWVWVASR